VILIGLTFVMVMAQPVQATLLPPPIRLARMFERVEWGSPSPPSMPIPPAHIVERLER